jgi:hypothetical protein
MTTFPAPHVPLTAIARPGCSLHVQLTALLWRHLPLFPNATAPQDTFEPISTNVCSVLLVRDVPIISFPRALLGHTLILEALTVPCALLGHLETLLEPQNVKRALAV